MDALAVVANRRRRQWSLFLLLLGPFPAVMEMGQHIAVAKKNRWLRSQTYRWRAVLFVWAKQKS